MLTKVTLAYSVVEQWINTDHIVRMRRRLNPVTQRQDTQITMIDGVSLEVTEMPDVVAASRRER